MTMPNTGKRDDIHVEARGGELVPRCGCGAAIGWTRLIRGKPCDACAIRNARERRSARLARHERHAQVADHAAR